MDALCPLDTVTQNEQSINHQSNKKITICKRHRDYRLSTLTGITYTIKLRLCCSDAIIEFESWLNSIYTCIYLQIQP